MGNKSPNLNLELVKLAPNLREIRFHASPSTEDCEVLAAFKHLRVIEMRTEFMGSGPGDDVEEHFTGQLTVLKRVLRDCSVTMKGYFLDYRTLVMVRTVHI